MSWHPNLWHPFTQVAGADPPLRAVGGQGALLELDDGRLLIDAISSWWVTLHGHGEPTIAAAIASQARQLEQVIFANFSHPAAETLASQLAALEASKQRHLPALMRCATKPTLLTEMKE